MKKLSSQALKNFIITVVQIIAYGILFLPFRILLRITRVLPKNLNELSRGSLLIANHRSKMDPFVVLAHLPFFTFLRILPIRFPVHHDFMKRRIFRYTLPFLGSYDIGGTPWTKMLGLLRTKKYLDQGTTVFLFPEGKINRDTIGEFEKGIHFFIDSGRKIIVVRIEGLERGHRAFLKQNNRLVFSSIFDTTRTILDPSELHKLIKQL
jgi:1-acyl-sn-glycerol-3-phosphate acyltransferase